MAVPPPAVPDVLMNVLHRPQYKAKDPLMQHFTTGGVKPLNGTTTPAELLTHSKAFEEIMTYNHQMRTPPVVIQAIAQPAATDEGHLSSGSAAESRRRAAAARRSSRNSSPISNSNVSPSREAPPNGKKSVQFEGSSVPKKKRTDSSGQQVSGNVGESAQQPNDTTTTPAHMIPPPPPQLVPNSSLPGDAMTLYAKNIEYHNSIVDLQDRLAAAEEEICALEEQLKICSEEYVPPKSFLPPGFYEEHKPVIDALNDYYVLYRVATAQKLLKRRADENQAAGLDLYGASDFTDDKGNLIATNINVSKVNATEMKEELLSRSGPGGGQATNQYLRERVADLTAKLRVIQQRRR